MRRRTASSVLAEFLGLVDSFDFEVKALYVDSEFYDGKCLTLMQAHNCAYVVPIIAWGNEIQQELSVGWSREIEHDLTTEFDGHEWTVEFSVYIDCTYQNGRYDEHGVARHGYAADAPFIDTPRQARSTTASGDPLPQAVRDRIELPALRGNDDFDHDTRSSASAAVRRDQPPVPERLAVLALGACGDAPPRRASPLVVAV